MCKIINISLYTLFRILRQRQESVVKFLLVNDVCVWCVVYAGCVVMCVSVVCVCRGHIRVGARVLMCTYLLGGRCRTETEQRKHMDLTNSMPNNRCAYR